MCEYSNGTYHTSPVPCLETKMCKQPRMLSFGVVFLPLARLCQSIIQPEFINTPMPLRKIIIIPLEMPFGKILTAHNRIFCPLARLQCPIVNVL